MTTNGLERTRFYTGQSLSVSDFQTEQSYFETLFKELNHALHLAGIVHGLEVTEGQRPGTLQVAPGLAVDDTGQALILGEERLVDVSGAPSQALYILLTASSRPSAPTSESGAVGYKRLLLDPAIELSPLGVAQGTSQVVLGKVFLDERGGVERIDPRVRQYCGTRVGQAAFASGNIPEEERPKLEADRSQSDRSVLMASADSATFSGVLLVTGTLRVNREYPHAQLDVASERSKILAVRDPNPALILDSQGQVGVGVETPEARLDIAGALRLDAAQAFIFDGAGRLQSKDNSSAVSFQDSPAGMELSVSQPSSTDASSLQLQAGQGTPPMVLYPNGHATIGGAQDSQDATLTVLGRVRSLQGGFRFKKGKPQTTAAVSTTIRVGMIIDWWLPPGMSRDLPDEFAICDGRTVTISENPRRTMKLPDLRELFVRGTADYMSIGQLGGSQVHGHELADVPKHTHGIRHNHGWYRGYSSSALGEPYSDSTDDKLTSFDHQHWMEIRVDNTETDSSKENPGVLDPPARTEEVENLPPYYGLVKIMRIK